MTSPPDFVHESLEPIAVRTDRPALFALRCLLDLQLLTIIRFLRHEARSWRSKVLDAGAGEAPWQALLPVGTQHLGVEVEHAVEFGMRPQPSVVVRCNALKQDPLGYALVAHVTESVA